MKYKISQYAKLEKVTYRTIWNRIKKGLLETETTPNGTYLWLLMKIKSKESPCIAGFLHPKTNPISKDRKRDFYPIAPLRGISWIKSYVK